MSNRSSTVPPLEIPLKILICDGDESAANGLLQALRTENRVLDASVSVDIGGARRKLRDSDINAVFIDPLSLGLDLASEFIFEIRETLPEVVFVLYVDKAAAENHRAEFYRGERSRFSHYYTLDKRTPLAAFRDELRSILDSCRFDLSWRMSEVSLGRLLEKAERLRDASAEVPPGFTLFHEVSSLLGDLSAGTKAEKGRPPKKTVFLSYRFAEEDYVKGLVKLLVQSGFDVVTGKSANTFISKAVLDRIKACEFFVCLMTRDHAKSDGTYTTSPWLLEEKGVALAFGKPLVLMVEEGVTDYGGLQGDWQRIHFGAKGFLTAALEAVEQLNSYAGTSPN
jgi:hypothetical protein